MVDGGRPFPRRLGRYTLIQRIASGGMATIDLARDERSGQHDAPRDVVIKRLHRHLARRPQHVRRFRREGEILMALDHPNVVRAFDFGESSGEPYLVLERLEGLSLARALVAALPRGLDHSMIAGIFADVARGLDGAHRLRRKSGEPWKLVHGDVSPQNVFLTESGEVKVLDFGLARPEGRWTDTDIPGKLAYLAPERVLGLTVDRRADIFALGVMLWESVTLHRLFKREDDEETKQRIIEHRVPAPSLLVPQLSRELESATVRALRLEPSGRFQTAEELATVLESVRGGDRETSRASLAALVRRRIVEGAVTHH